MKKWTQLLLLPIVCLAFCLQAPAQLTLSGQLRTRTEFRDGQGASLPLVLHPPSLPRNAQGLASVTPCTG